VRESARDTLDPVSSRVRTLVRLTFVLLAAHACSTAEVPVAAPRGGHGDFRVIIHAAPLSLNPDLATDEPSLVVGRNIFNQLIAVDSEQNLIPDLARAWDVSEDGQTYTFHLTEGVSWHDGQPLTSADVKWTFEALKSGSGLGHDVANRIAVIEAPDDHTVTFRLGSPWAPFLAEIASFGTFVLPRHVYSSADWRTAPANDRPIGTGPFRFASWSKPGPIVLVANPRYFGHGPYLDRLTFVIAAPDRIDDLLIEGAADYTVVRPSIDVLAPLQQHGLVIHTSPSDSRYYCAFNMTKGPFSDPRVRRAVNLGIDRLELVERALGGYGAPAFTFYTPMVEWAHNSAARVGMADRGAARALLDAAGFKPDRRGVRISATLIVASDVAPFGDIARHLRGQLREIGLAIDVEPIPLNAWIRRAFDTHDFDLALFGGTQGPDPDVLRLRFGTGSFFGYSNPAFDRTVDEAARTLDVSRRARAYFRAQEILSSDLPVAPLAEAVRVVVYNKRVSGLPQVEARSLVAPYDFSLVRMQN
jgi:peptide/nickel transport system substrate-binding protein